MSEDNGATVHCLHCGQKYAMNLPCIVSVWVAAMKEFSKVHRNCRDQRIETKRSDFNAAGVRS